MKHSIQHTTLDSIGYSEGVYTDGVLEGILYGKGI